MTIDTIDLIKALEERKRQLSKWTDKDRAKERIDEINCIIDTDIPYLVKEESEKPVTTDLEEAAENIYKTPFGTRAEDFQAGARWQKEQMISALKNDGELPIEFIDKFHEIDRNAFQNGQKNVKEQMLKDAEECDLYWDGDFLAIDLNMRVLGYSERDQVKIVIVKEDKK